MADILSCFRCGASLEALSLPLSRRDECPECSIHVHVCRMCVFFAAHVPKQCREDDAEEVIDKEKVNFCEWFKPSVDAFDPARAGQARQAKTDLEALFDDEPQTKAEPDAAMRQAEDLFK
jgi:hypothetical protein